MSVTARLVQNETELSIELDKRFDFTQANDFRKLYRNLPVKSKYVIDMAQVEYMDSAAIGMLLLLKEFVGGEPPSPIAIVNCRSDVRDMLHLTHMEQFFDIS